MSTLVVAGLQKTSLIDFPGKVSCVVFLSGCNFSCPYCHNPELAQGGYPARLSLAEVMAFLQSRRAFLDGVVISGGEPCLRPDLPVLCRAIRELGLAVKLDTNGSRPDVLEQVIDAALVDYIAMDLKTAPDNYGPPLCPEGSGKAVVKSIDLIMKSSVDYEFRTTCVPPFVDEEIMKRMAGAIKGARRYILQKFNPATVLDPGFFPSGRKAPGADRLLNLQSLAEPLVSSCTIR